MARTRKITLVSIRYNVGKIDNGAYHHVTNGETFDTTGAETAKRELEKQFPAHVVQTEKIERDYVLDVQRAIDAGVLIPADSVTEQPEQPEQAEG